MNYLDYNIDDFSLNEYIMENDIISNPLYNNKKQNIYDEKNNKWLVLDEMKKNDLYEIYKNIYIICLRNGMRLDNKIYNKTINKDYWNENKLKINVIEMNLNILNDELRNMIGIINREMIMDISNKYENNYRENNLYIFLPMLEEQNINNYLKQYNGIINLEEIYNMYLLDQLLCNKNNKNQKLNRIKMINSMIESDYWSNKNNTHLNITLKFIERGFNLSLQHRLQDTTVINVLKILANNNVEDNNYLSFLFRKTLYTDASSGINKTGYKIYRLTNNNLVKKINNETIIKLLNISTITERYYLITNLLVSKDYCHLIINNKELLKELSCNRIYDKKDISSASNKLTFFEKNYSLIRYLLSYTWLTFYLEESIKKSYIDDNDRFVFDIETASLLPHYPFIEKDIHLCPYLPILVENSILDTEKNVLGVTNTYVTIPDQTKQHLYRYGVCDLETFKNRLRLFINGKNKYDLLKDIRWDNLGLTGSVMAACLPNFNPLMLNFITNDIYTDENFIDFTNYYYNEADIDIMCNILDYFKFIDRVLELKNDIVKNINELETNNINESYKLQHLKTIVIMINKNYIDKLIKSNNYFKDLDYKDIILNLNKEDIKKIIYNDYIKWQINENEKYFNTPEFTNINYIPIFEISHIDNVNIIFIKSKNDIINDNKKWSENIINKLNNKDNNDDNKEDKELDEIINDDNDIIIKVNLKYKFSSKYLIHPLEIFQTKYNNFFATVSRFHLPPVRSYYNGNTVLMLPSCITACHTFLNIDYKYFAGTKDPIEIINKYRFRGFGTLLNDKEKIRFLEYSSLIPKWNILYNNIKKKMKNKNNINQIFGSKQYNNLFYTNNLNKNNKYFNIQQPGINNSYINNLIENLNQNNNNSIINKIKMINNKGYILPLQKYLIEFNHNKHLL